jgi:hypothetical protein
MFPCYRAESRLRQIRRAGRGYGIALEPQEALFADVIFFELSVERGSLHPENARRLGFVAHCIFQHSPGYILSESN